MNHAEDRAKAVGCEIVRIPIIHGFQISGMIRLSPLAG